MERLRAEGIDPYPPVTLWGKRTRITESSPRTMPKRWSEGAHPDCATSSPGG